VSEGDRLLWAVYDASYGDLQDEVREAFRAHPEFGPLVRDLPRDPAEEERSYRVLEAAMARGEWGPYWDSVRRQATGYANAEISFASWFDLVNYLRSRLFVLLLDAYEDRARLREAVVALDRWLDTAMGVFGSAFVAASEQVIARQERAIRLLSTPVLQVRPGLLILPIVGALDRERLDQLQAELLAGIRQRRARVAVIDVTAVPEIDSMVANQLIETVAAARMMGAEVIVSGLSAEIAQTLVTVGVDLARVVSAGDLQSGMERADRILRGL
jgi:anti-anti-sigma regulatory factor